MKVFVFTAHFLVVAVLLSSSAPGAEAGRPCFNCPNIPPLSCPNGLVAADCDSDCKAIHYSAGGTCDTNFNCICSGPPANNGTCGAVILNQTTPICQCQSNDTDSGPKYQDFCNDDCQCNHGAEFGTCLFDKQQCQCGSSANFIWTSATCTAPGGVFNVDEAIQSLIDMLNG